MRYVLICLAALVAAGCMTTEVLDDGTRDVVAEQTQAALPKVKKFTPKDWRKNSQGLLCSIECIGRFKKDQTTMWRFYVKNTSSMIRYVPRPAQDTIQWEVQPVVKLTPPTAGTMDWVALRPGQILSANSKFVLPNGSYIIRGKLVSTSTDLPFVPVRSGVVKLDFD